MKTAKEFIEVLEGLQNHLHDRTARPSDILVMLREKLEEYGEIKREYYELRENYKTYQELQEMLRDVIDAWINRLYYFIGDVNIYDVSIMYVDNYWNCDHKVSYDELWNVIEGIIEDLEKALKKK